MPVLTMYRDGEIAYVNTDHAATYENFLANGWTDKLVTAKAEAPQIEAPVNEPEEEVAPEAETPARAPRKAK